MARRTKNAAKEVASLVSKKFCTKLARPLWRFAIQPVPMPPLGKDAGTPNEGNQLMSCGRVRNTIAQNIHVAKLPPTKASGTEPCRRPRPASTRQMMAAEGASSSINLMKSVISCGGAMVVTFQRETGRRRRVSLSRACLSVGLSDSGGALGNPVFEQSGHA